MSHDHEHGPTTKEKLMVMANQIATFFHSKPREEGIAGVADHINKFWEPRMRRMFFEMIDGGQPGFDEFVLKAAPSIRRPPAQQDGPPPLPVARQAKVS